MKILPSTSKQKRRFYTLAMFVLLMLLGCGILIFSLQKFTIYYYTPSKALEAKLYDTQSTVRLGGLVAAGSIEIQNDGTIFKLTDEASSLTIKYNKALPSLFREGSGAVVEGKFADNNTFIAENILAKHDETYKPPEN